MTQTHVGTNTIGGLNVTPTPIDVDRLETELVEHPNRTFVSTLITCLRQGFYTGINNLPLKNLECPNNRSAKAQPDIVNQLISAEVKQGFLVGPFKNSPFSLYRVSPLGLAEGTYSGKMRLIVDLSAPHNNDEHSSLNQLINKEDYSLSYVKLDDAIQEIRDKGQGSWLCKTDIVDAFKQIPIHPSLWHLYGVKWNGEYFFYTRLVFGSRSSPKIFDWLSQAICWIAHHNYGIDFILHLLDDFLTVDSPNVTADRTMAILSLIFNRLHIPIAPHKTVGPTVELQYLGIILNTSTMQAKLPKEKILRIINILDRYESKNSISKRDMLKLLGHLQFATRVVRPGRTFVGYLLSLASSVKELHHHVRLNKECRLDIAMWRRFLAEWNGVALFLDPEMTNAADFALYTDAAATVGYGGFFQNRWFQGRWPSQLMLKNNEQLSMAFLELYPIVVAAMLWGSEWNGKQILFYCDNEATVHIINKGRSKIQCIMRLMRRLTWCAASGNFSITAKHIPGINNDVADALSRFQIDRFRQLAPGAALNPCQCPPPSDVMWY